MKFSPALSFCLFLGATAGVFGAPPVTNAAPNASSASKKKATAHAHAEITPAPNPPATPPAAVANPPVSPQVTLADFLKDLTAAIHLSDADKKEIETYYLNDVAPIQKILNDATLSPMQQAQQVADLRDSRNAKIAELLQSVVRQRKFLQIEAKYRVALMELAADGRLVAAPPAAAAPSTNAPSSAPPASAGTGEKRRPGLTSSATSAASTRVLS